MHDYIRLVVSIKKISVSNRVKKKKWSLVRSKEVLRIVRIVNETSETNSKFMLIIMFL